MVLGSVTINYWAVLVAAVFSMLVGAFWYSPTLFQKQWMKYSGITQQTIDKAKKSGMFKLYFYAFIAIFVMAYVTAFFVDYSGASNFLDGIQIGFLVWIGYIATTMINTVLWDNKPWQLYFINAGHYLVVAIIMGIILATWK